MVSRDIITPNRSHVAILCDLGKTTFAETFIGMAYYTKDIVDGYTSGAFTPEVIARELEDPHVQYFLLSVDGVYVGYAKLVEKEPAPCIRDLRAIYLERIYFTKASQGKGLGKKLMARVYEEARNRGYENLWLSVWEYNTGAVEFYRRLGFHHAGAWDWKFESHGVAYVDRDWVFTIAVPPAG